MHCLFVWVQGPGVSGFRVRGPGPGAEGSGRLELRA